MLLKSIQYRIERNPQFMLHERNNASMFITIILMNIQNPIIWPWKTNDHMILLRHFDKITEQLQNFNNIDINAAYDTIYIQSRL